ncbi:hypothetical protein [Qaidamihabitans albus]|uniref:hypothetical protein n=1 Tax=Qaidamihabitans albus TaxID=2795733 RepID=UPI0018F2018B|nr:hypothetical protein [Qaidamihabitans albus]
MSYPPQGWQQPGYPPPPGYPPAGYPPPGYGPGGPYGPPRQSTAMAYVAALLFLPAVVYTYLAAVISWDGRTDNAHMLASTVGMAFSGELTGNVDFAIAASMSVASTALALALALLFRLGFIRWLLVGVAALVTAYYVYAVGYLLSEGAAEYVIMPIVALLLWVAPLVVALLPAVGRAMRGHRPPVAHGHWR